MSSGALLLALHIACSVSFGHILKWALRRGCSLTAVGAINYLVASLFSAATAAIGGTIGLVSPTIALVAAIGGMSFVISYFVYVQAIKLVGVSIATTTIRLAVLPAIAASIIIWLEAPTTAQVAGASLCLASLPLLSFQPGDKSARVGGPVWLWLLALFGTTAGGPLAAKIFQEMGLPDAKPVLMACWFGTSAIAALLVLRRQKLRPSRGDFPLGLLLGAVNVVGNFCLLAALEYLPAAIVFPVASAGGVLLVAITSALLWNEKISRPATAGIFISSIALVLVNLG